MNQVAHSHCPNILELVETFTDDEFIYIASKFHVGGDLFNYLRKQPNLPLDEEHAKQIIKQVATGVQALHQRNIVHRDIKLDNILMTNTTRDASVRIADLGSAFTINS